MKKIEVFEGERAIRYDEAIRKWFPNYDNLNKLIFPLLSSKLDQNRENQILVVGSGTGNELSILARLKPNWNFVGVDPSREMNALAKEKVSRLSNVEIVEGTIEDVKGQFDGITSLLVTHFFDIETKSLILQTIYNKLNERGILVLSDIAGSKGVFEENYECFKAYQELEIEDEMLIKGLHHIKHDLYYISEEELISILNLSGFKRVTRFFQWLIYHAWLVEK